MEGVYHTLQSGHGFKSLKQPLAEMQGKTAYIRPKVVEPFLGPCASGSYMHRTALYIIHYNFQTVNTYYTLL
jgi:hypothetical protein